MDAPPPHKPHTPPHYGDIHANSTATTTPDEVTGKDGHHHQTNLRPEKDDRKKCDKEDDMRRKKEEDLHQVSNVRKTTRERDGHQPPPLGRAGLTSLNRTGNLPITTGELRSTQGVVNLEGCSVTPHADIKCGDRNSDVKEEVITTGRSRISGITVNGIDLMTLQRMKGDIKKKDLKTEKKQSRKSKFDKLSPAPPSESIRKFLKKRKPTEPKQEEEEETVNVRKEDKVNTSVKML